MTRSLSIAFVLCFVFTAEAQIAPEKLSGTWTLIKYDYGNGQTGDQTKAKFKKIKIITPGYFTVLDFDTTWADVKTVIRGNYEFITGKKPETGSSMIRQHILGGSINSNYKQIQDSYFNYRIDDEDMMHVTGKIGYVDISELWMHVNEEKDVYGAGETLAKSFEKLLQNPKRVLYVLKTKEGDILVKQNESYATPFALLPKNSVSEVEIINDEEGIQRYGMDARFGSIIIKLNDEFLTPILMKLRKQKNID
jgi:hypothetical protein